MPNAWRAYLEMALGLTEAPRKKAQQAAAELVNRGGATTADVLALAREVRDGVEEAFGVRLVNEPVLVGETL